MAVVLPLAVIACAWLPPADAAHGQGTKEREVTRVPDPENLAAVTIAILPYGTEPADLGRIDGLSPGVMSAGLSKVSPIQTYLDIGQGNRVFTSLYDREPPVPQRFGDRVPRWGEIVARAQSAPAEIVPGLLASVLGEAGIPVRVDSLLATPALLAADEGGRLRRTPPLECLEVRCPGLAVVPATVGQLGGLIEKLRGSDLLIAMERAAPPERETLAIGIAGRGLAGTLTSDTTRTDGLVLSTDLAPTILERYGLTPPDEMSGEPIRAEGEADGAAVQDRAGRMKVVAPRRGPVVLDNLIIWLALALVASGAALWRGAHRGAGVVPGRAAPVAFGLLGLSCIYLPLLLLVGAALEPSELGERLLVGIGSPACAATTLALARGWTALAVACAITAGAYALDVVLGSPLTARSLLGPNPGLGVRFFGIGNELEAVLAVIVPAGVGAALAAGGVLARPRGRKLAIGAFLVVGFLAAGLFAAGPFGADVGAAIVLPVGGAVAALAVPGATRRGRLLLLVLAAPIAGLALLGAVDLVLGGDAHLSRSVFEAGGADEVADVAERRLRLSASSFDRGTGQPLFWFAVGSIVAGIFFRRRIRSWLEEAPLARSGFAGAAAGAAVGMVANDSGSVFLIVGTICLLACLSFAYSQARIGESRGISLR